MAEAKADRIGFKPQLRDILKKLTVSKSTDAWALAITTRTSTNTDALSVTVTGSTDWGDGNRLAAGRFYADASTATGGQLHGIYAKTKLASGGIAKGINTAIYGVIDLNLATPSASVGTPYALVLEHAASATRVGDPDAFICFIEGDSVTKPTKYLFDIGFNGIASIATGSNATTPVMATTATDFVSDANKSLGIKVRVNGNPYWIALYDATASTNA